uniref:Uncharacterized protein n=1 Tax=Romanomermis culicivorax TaxID=13658 RepID=A0A915J6E8_ROMCU
MHSKIYKLVFLPLQMVKYKALRYDGHQVVVQPTGPSEHDTVLLLCPSHFGARHNFGAQRYRRQTPMQIIYLSKKRLPNLQDHRSVEVALQWP